MCSLFGSYLARIGWQGRSSARLESWWPHTHTSLDLFPRCSQSAMLLQDRERQREKGNKMISWVCRKIFQRLTAWLCTLSPFHLEIFVCLVCYCYILTVGSPPLYCFNIKLRIISVRHQQNGLWPHRPGVGHAKDETFRSSNTEQKNNPKFPPKSLELETSLKMTFYKLRWNFKDLLLHTSSQARDSSLAAGSLLSWRMCVPRLAVNWQQLHSFTPWQQPDNDPHLNLFFFFTVSLFYPPTQIPQW